MEVDDLWRLVGAMMVALGEAGVAAPSVEMVVDTAYYDPDDDSAYPRQAVLLRWPCGDGVAVYTAYVKDMRRGHQLASMPARRMVQAVVEHARKIVGL